ncbi:MAG TPA: methylmalonyl-CoA epimerase [Pyrinomonadaceae bacterium]|nr:methylmalonyl-CoA epimerase [Pyrinomonadaceae bacterium]
MPRSPPGDAKASLRHIMKIDHIGIATNGIETTASIYAEALGLEVAEIEEVAGQKVRVAMLPVGESRIELLEATSAESPISKFLEKRGPGIHHLAFKVSDIRASLAELKSKGARLIDEEPRPGAGGCLVAFIHPSSTGGVLIELVERPE